MVTRKGPVGTHTGSMGTRNGPMGIYEGPVGIHLGPTRILKGSTDLYSISWQEGADLISGLIIPYGNLGNLTEN